MSQVNKEVGIGLGIGILFLPYLFSWFTLRKGYSVAARVVSISWMVLLLLGFYEKNQTIDGFDAQTTCEYFVKKNLKAPTTASFASYQELQISGSGSGPWTVIGYVDSQNSFGAEIRSKYSCTIHYQGDTAHLDDIVID